MTELAAERRARTGEEEPTAPFVLDRAAERVSEPGAPRAQPADGPPGGAPGAPPLELIPAPARLDRAGRRATRLLVAALLLDALVLLFLVGVSAVRVTEAGAGIPDLMVGGLALILALPCLLAAHSLRRVGQLDPIGDAHLFAHGIGHLRGIFMLKAGVLFTALGLSCFAFSLIASLLALS